METEFVEAFREEVVRLGLGFAPAAIRPIGRAEFKREVVDAPMIFRVEALPSSAGGVLIVSNREHPDFVSTAVQKAVRFAEAVGPAVDRPVLRPTTTGRLGTQSYALWPLHRPISEYRILKRLETLAIAPRVVEWIVRVAEASRHVALDAEIADRYLEPLRYLAEEAAVSSELRRAAAFALARVERGAIAPVHVAQHGDFWHGNVLLDRAWPLIRERNTSPFHVIDWGSANIEGYPFYDLLRFGYSADLRRGVMDAAITRYARACGVDRADLPVYALVVSGFIGLHRDNFPLARYLASTEALFARASALA